MANKVLTNWLRGQLKKDRQELYRNLRKDGYTAANALITTRVMQGIVVNRDIKRNFEGPKLER